ncbi:hypothetical protein BJ742DRAFT_838689 [Cladochytrium replicatum]|nr:hypothetical protein BJ742DRAFT_838689 [Cladochytrium replicatum]
MPASAPIPPRSAPHPRPPRSPNPRPRTPMGTYTGTEPLSSLAIPTPGPLDYIPTLPPSGFHYSILGKHPPRISRTEGPGPAAVNVREVREVFWEDPHWSLGVKRPELKKRLVTPAPGTYSANQDEQFAQGKPATSISGSFGTQANETPGPDRYFPPSEFGSAPKYSFRLKPVSIEDPNPGPMDYDSPWVLPSAKSAPAYTMRPFVGEKVFSDSEAASRPAPNKYYPELGWSEIAASLKGWFKESKSTKTPGPANYIMPNTLFSGPQPSFTGRNIPYEDEPYYVPPPGPSDYSPKAENVLWRAPAFSLGTPAAERSPTPKSVVPGPGAYEPRDRQVRGNGAPKVTLKSRHSSRIESTPGPADYRCLNDTIPSREAVLARMALVKSRASDRTSTPKRSTSAQPTPGPASYDLKPLSITKPSGPQYSLARRLQKQKSAPTPGPNAYDGRVKSDGARISLKSRSSPYVLAFPSTRVDKLRA